MNYDDRFQQTPPDFEDDEPFAHGGYTNGHNPNTLWNRKQGDYWAGREPPPYPWLMEEWIIRGQCTGLYGVGGVRKTDFMLQLMVATALGRAFCGIEIPAGKTYGLFCEDSDDDIGRRLHRISHFYQTTPLALHDLSYASLVGVEETEFVAFDFGRVMTTKALDQFERDIEEFKPKLVCLDAVSDFFGGNEVFRREVAQFIRRLDRIALKRNCAILFSAHPSVRGRSTRLLDSGSTGWENKVRARLTLHDPINDGVEEKDIENPFKQSNQRILTRAKSNYAEQGVEIPLILKHGGFFPENIDPDKPRMSKLDREIRCRSLFLEILADITANGNWVNSAQSEDNYAPTVFAQHERAAGYSKNEFKAAMRWNLANGRLKKDTVKTGGRTYPCIKDNRA